MADFRALFSAPDTSSSDTSAPDFRKAFSEPDSPWFDALDGGSTIAPKGGTPYNMQASAAPSTAGDVLKSFGGGLERGASALVGLPGDAIKVLRKVAGYAGLPTSTTPVLGSREALQETEKLVGKPYEPQTVPGQYARTVGEFAPAAIGGPEGMAGRAARYVLAPAVASETAGQATKGTALEPYARFAGSMVGMGGAGAARGAIAERSAMKALPSTDELENMAHRAYKEAEDAGVVVKDESFTDMTKNIRAEITNKGFDPDLHPQAARVLAVMEKRVGAAKSLGELDTLRQVVGDVAKSPEAGERRIAKLMKNHIDDYLDNLSPADVESGHALVSVNALKQARSLWQRKSKSELLENVFEKAKDTAGQYSVSGMENALRTQFRRLAGNAKKMRTFTQEERKAIRRVARGGPVQNILRFFGKFAPKGAITGYGTGAAAYAMGGPAAAGIAGTGFAAHGAAAAMAERNVNRVRELMVSGKIAKRPKPAPLSAALSTRAALLNALGLTNGQ